MQSFKEGFTKNWFLGVCIVIGSFILGQRVGHNFAAETAEAQAEAKQDQENQDNDDNSGDNSSGDNSGS